MEELKLYKKLLFRYQLSRFLPKTLLATEYGLCFTTMVITNLNFTDNFCLKTHCPILYSIRPARSSTSMYWFQIGLLSPRIELLKQAIKICQQKKS